MKIIFWETPQTEIFFWVSAVIFFALTTGISILLASKNRKELVFCNFWKILRITQFCKFLLDAMLSIVLEMSVSIFYPLRQLLQGISMKCWFVFWNHVILTKKSILGVHIDHQPFIFCKHTKCMLALYFLFGDSGRYQYRSTLPKKSHRRRCGKATLTTTVQVTDAPYFFFLFTVQITFSCFFHYRSPRENSRFICKKNLCCIFNSTIKRDGLVHRVRPHDRISVTRYSLIVETTI